MKVAIASDHGGFQMKEQLKQHLVDIHVTYIDCGTDSEASCDYPDYAEKACRLVQDKSTNLAVLICGTGLGMSIAANKMHGIRAAVCGEEFSAHYARAHNDANVLALGARVIGQGLAERIVDTFLEGNFEGGRHERRVQKMACLESDGC